MKNTFPVYAIDQLKNVGVRDVILEIVCKICFIDFDLFYFEETHKLNEKDDSEVVYDNAHGTHLSIGLELLQI